MGSGKTYEVASVVILGALRSGRRVVSNIAGLNFDLFKQLLLEEGIPEGQIGTIVQVSHEEVLKPLFWRTDKDIEEGIEAFVQPGDLLALDEIWRFWDGFKPKCEDGDKVIRRPDRVMNFFRMHRHFTHPETGVSCEVAIITQDVTNDIHRSVRGVVEETYLMEKLTEIGSTTRYRVNIFPRTRITRRPQRQLQRSYDPKYFGLYSSHSQRKEGDADAVEDSIDKRGNIFGGAMFKVILPLALIMFCFAFWGVWRFLHPTSKSSDPPQLATGPAPGVAGTPGVSPAKPTTPAVSDEWRVVGYFDTGNGFGYQLLLSNGERGRLLQPPIVKVNGFSAEGLMPSGEFATSWSGAKNRQGPLGAMR